MEVYPFDCMLAVSDNAQLMQHNYTIRTELPIGFFASLALVKPHRDLQTILVCVAWSHPLRTSRIYRLLFACTDVSSDYQTSDHLFASLSIHPSSY